MSALYCCRVLVLRLRHVHDAHLHRDLSSVVDEASTVGDVSGDGSGRLLRAHAVTVQRTVLRHYIRVDRYVRADPARGRLHVLHGNVARVPRRSTEILADRRRDRAAELINVHVRLVQFVVAQRDLTREVRRYRRRWSG